jgi:hypothetical protein
VLDTYINLTEKTFLLASNDGMTEEKTMQLILMKLLETRKSSLKTMLQSAARVTSLSTRQTPYRCANTVKQFSAL